MANVFDIAAYITNYIEVDQLKLQKLLFYTQAVSLVRFNKPAFSSAIEAWDYGPVIPEVYTKIRRYKTPLKIKYATKESIDACIIEAADMVIKYYGEMDGIELMQLTHSEQPWRNAYKKGRNTEITNRAIKAYYKTIFIFDENE